MTRARLVTLSVVVAAAAPLGCGGGGTDDDGGSAPKPPAPATDRSGGGPGGKLALAADPGGGLKFDKTRLRSRPGEVTVTLTNDSSVPHAVAIEGGATDVSSATVTGKSATVTAKLSPGEYRFYCPVGGHAQAGMEGKLTVR